MKQILKQTTQQINNGNDSFIGKNMKCFILQTYKLINFCFRN